MEVAVQVGTDYPRPVMVNGYPCHNCKDVSAAKRGEDPAQAAGQADPAVAFGDSLVGRSVSSVPAAAGPQALVDRLV